MNEAVNESSKLVAQAIEQLKPLTDFAWVDDQPAYIEIDPVISLLEAALVKLTNAM